jgi:hypothetical protein
MGGRERRKREKEGRKKAKIGEKKHRLQKTAKM